VDDWHITASPAILSISDLGAKLRKGHQKPQSVLGGRARNSAIASKLLQNLVFVLSAPYRKRFNRLVS
jgi:hypothetical protein